MIVFVVLIFCFHRELDTELFQLFDIHRGEHNRSMCLAFGKFRQLFHSQSSIFMSGGTDGQGDQDLIGMQSRIAASEVSSFQTLDRLQRFRCYDIFLVVNAGKLFLGI